MDELSNAMDKTFLALSHPTRRKMLDMLSEGGRRVTDLAACFPSALNVVSKHIRVMERAGLVRRERSGRVHQIRLETTPLRDAAAFIERYRERWEGKLDHLGDYLDRMEAEEKKTPSPKAKSRKSTN